MNGRAPDGPAGRGAGARRAARGARPDPEIMARLGGAPTECAGGWLIKRDSIGFPREYVPTLADAVKKWRESGAFTSGRARRFLADWKDKVDGLGTNLPIYIRRPYIPKHFERDCVLSVLGATVPGVWGDDERARIEKREIQFLYYREMSEYALAAARRAVAYKWANCYTRLPQEPPGRRPGPEPRRKGTARHPAKPAKRGRGPMAGVPRPDPGILRMLGAGTTECAAPRLIPRGRLRLPGWTLADAVGQWRESGAPASGRARKFFEEWKRRVDGRGTNLPIHLRGKGIPRKLEKECVDQVYRVTLNGLWDDEDEWRFEDWPCNERDELLRLCGRQMSEYALAAARHAVAAQENRRPPEGQAG